MIPIVISKRAFSGVSKKTGKSFNSVIYNVLSLDRYGNYIVKPVFVSVDDDPALRPGDRVVLDSLSGSLILHPSASSDEEFVTHLHSL